MPTTRQLIQQKLDALPLDGNDKITGEQLIEIFTLCMNRSKDSVDLANVNNTSDLDKPVSIAVQTALNALQPELVSGTNIKTVNGLSILGAGNIAISGGSSETDADNYIHIILSGQSNSTGRGLNTSASASELAEQTTVEIWNSTTGAYENLNIGAGNNQCDIADKHGIELGLALNFQTYFPNRKLRLIKYGVGGTGIDQHLAAGAVYTTLYNSYVTPAINQTISEGKGAELVFVFAQGEFNSNTQALADAFEAQHQQHVNLWQGNLGEKLPMYYIQIIEDDPTADASENARHAQINDAFRASAKTEHFVDYLLTKDLSTDDNLHYNYSALKDISVLLLKEMKRNRSSLIIKEPINAPNTMLPYNLRFDITNQDHVVLDSQLVLSGEFYVEFKIRLQAVTEASGGYGVLFDGGTLGNSSRFVVSPSQDKIVLTIGGTSYTRTNFSFELDDDFVFRAERDASNNLLVGVAGDLENLGSNSGTVYINHLFREIIMGTRWFGGLVEYIDLNGDVYELTEGTGTTITSTGSNTATITTTGSTSYVNDTMWL